MYAVANNATRRLCQQKLSSLQRISGSLYATELNNHNKLPNHRYTTTTTNINYVAVRHRGGSGLVFLPPIMKQISRFSTTSQPVLEAADRSDSATVPANAASSNNNSNVKFAIMDLSRILDKLENTLNTIGTIRSIDVAESLKILRSIIMMNVNNDKDLSSLPYNFGDILLRSCGLPMINELPQWREDLAGQIWFCVKQLSSQLNISHYNTLLKVFLDNKTQFDPSKLLAEINSNGIHPNRVTYQRMLHRYCLMGEIPEAMKILEHMKEDGIEINESVFVSLITGYGVTKDTQSISQIFSLMRENGLEPSSQTYVAHICALINSDSPEQTIRDMLDEIAKEDIVLSTSDYYDILNALVRKTENHPLFEEIFENLKESEANFTNFNETLKHIITMVHEGHYMTASRIFWNMRHSNKEKAKGRIGSFYLNAMVLSKQVPADHIIQECKTLQDRGMNLKPYQSIFPIAATRNRLDVLESLIGCIGESDEIKCHYYWPFIAQTDAKGTIDVLKNKLKPSMNNEELFYTFTEMVWPKLDKSAPWEEILQQILSLGYDKPLIMSSFLEYILQEEKLSELGDVLPALKDDTSIRSKSGTRSESFVKPRLANSSMRTLLDKEDTKGATELYLMFANNFSITPSNIDMMERLLKEKNNQDLQRVIDACNKIHGESNTLTELAIACMRSNHVKQAEKIFKSPGVRVNAQRLDQSVEYFFKRRWPFALENFLASTKSLYTIDREKAYHALLTLYDQKNEAKKTLELCVQAQENEYQLGSKSTSLAAKILERNNMEVPFSKPN